MNRKGIASILAAVVMTAACTDRMAELQGTLTAMAEAMPAEVGIAVICGGDTLSVNGDCYFPMFSVVKFPQALAVSEVLQGKQEDVAVAPGDLKPDTWSPLREQFPEGGTFTVRQLMEYSLVESDNNASDILFERFAGPAQVQDCISRMGIEGFSVRWTEDEQHAEPMRGYDNRTTPLAAAALLGKFHDIRDSGEDLRFIWDTMAECNTGAARIPKYIAGKVTSIIHKTGTGFVLEDGTVTGINDIACIILPDGAHFELAVFVKDAECTPAECEEFIARASDACVTALAH